MTFRALAPQLHSTALAARAYFHSEHGATGFVVEEAFAKNSNYVTTFTAKLADHYAVCIEVRDKAYATALDEFVVECITASLPVKLYVAMPTGAGSYKEFKDDLLCARRRGVGIVEVDNAGGTVLNPAVSLSLAGLRRVRPLDYPQKIRQALRDAENTFLMGDPPKGCGNVYDLIENLTRALARKMSTNGMWPTAPNFNFDADPWQNIMDHVQKNANFQIVRGVCPDLKPPLFAQVCGIIPNRNESGHRPKTRAQLKSRDEKLKTRFETACDLLRDLILAVRPLRIRC